MPSVRAAEEGSSPETASPAPSAAQALRWPALLHLLGILAVAALLVVLHVDSFPRVSAIDETQHGDWLYRIADGEIVRGGDDIGDEILAEVDRRGGSFPGDMSRMPNHAFVHPPTYYVVTAAGGLALMAITPIDSLLTAGRLIGVLWLSGTLVLVWFACRRLEVPPMARWGAILLFASMPSVLHLHSVVSVDAAATFAGAAVVAAVLRWEGRGRGLVVLGLAAGLTGLLKSPALLVVGWAVLYLLLRGVQARDRAPGAPALARTVAPGHLVAAAVLLGAGLLPGIAWVIAALAMTHQDPTQIPLVSSGIEETFELRWLLHNAGRFVSPVSGPHVPEEVALLAYLPFAGAATWLGSGAAFGAPLLEAPARLRAFGAAMAVLMVVGPPVFVVVNYLATDMYFLVPARYGLPLAAGFFVLIAAASRRRWYAPSLLALGATSATATLWVLLTSVPVAP